MQDADIILSAKHICKSFPGVQALADAELTVKRGEVHALMGENGAGKSTIIKIIGGIYPLDSGEIMIKGEERHFRSIHDAAECGISIIHQELCLSPNRTVAENIFMGREPLIPHTPFVDKKKINEDTKDIFRRLGIEGIAPNDSIDRLSISKQQMVEIARTLSTNADIIIMDEPTSSLTDKETKMLFRFIRDLKEKHISIIFISHRFEEIFEIADSVSVFRNGKFVGASNIKDVNREKLIQMMVGRKLFERDSSDAIGRTSGKKVLEVRNVSTPALLKNVSFDLHTGDILGVYGLVGAGRTELARAIMGIDRMQEGEIVIDGEKLKKISPEITISKGLALIPENRKEQGLVLINTVRYNLTLAVLHLFIKGASVNAHKQKQIIEKYTEALSIKMSSDCAAVMNLSGGNQQKVIIAKWLATAPKVLILDEPTRGIDIGAKAEIYKIMQDLAGDGIGIIVISSEIEEIIHLSTRAMVMYEGGVTAIIDDVKDINKSNLLHCAMGGGEKLWAN
jgi:ribose transport system ATP-binding protein/inositol transport system ATP-binding protein